MTGTDALISNDAPRPTQTVPTSRQGESTTSTPGAVEATQNATNPAQGNNNEAANGVAQQKVIEAAQVDAVKEAHAAVQVLADLDTTPDHSGTTPAVEPDTASIPGTDIAVAEPTDETATTSDGATVVPMADEDNLIDNYSSLPPPPYRGDPTAIPEQTEAATTSDEATVVPIDVIPANDTTDNGINIYGMSSAPIQSEDTGDKPGDVLKAENDQLRNDKQQLQNDLDAAKRDNADLSSQLSDVNNKNRELRDQVAQLQDKLQTVGEQVNELSARLQELIKSGKVDPESEEGQGLLALLKQIATLLSLEMVATVAGESSQ